VKKKPAKQKETPQPTAKPSGSVSDTLSAAIDIDLIQKQQDKNSKRIGVLLDEHSKLVQWNSVLEARRQEKLREFERAVK
jgi:hypothetical protein